MVSSSTDPAAVPRMLAALRHRGPDDEGVEHVGDAVLGVRRLSIIDLAGGHQPMRNETGSVVAVQNGEIYNYRELRIRLIAAGHELHTQSDTEILPHLYEDHGLDMVKALHGMFAIAVWDASSRQLLLARDRLGKKPLAYAQEGDDLFFASEIQALLTLPRLSREIDDAAIEEYLTYGYIPAPRTGFARVRKLEPGSLLVFKDGTLRTQRYWSLDFGSKRLLPRAEAAVALRARIDTAVQARLVSDVPIGALLSGGLDSSAIVAFMSRHVPKVSTFSIGFEDQDFNELRYARLVARAFATDHHELVVRPPSSDVIPMLARHLGEPFADSSVIPTYHVARIAREYVTVALNGDGGDELFGGYPRYRAVALAGGLSRIPGVRPALGLTADLIAGPLLRSRIAARMKRLLEGLALPEDERYFRWMGYFTGARVRVIKRRAAGARSTSAYLTSLADRAGAATAVDRALASDYLAYLPGDLLVKMDIATMACSLEGRSPFLDHELVEFMAALQWQDKVSVRATKVLFREAMQGILPHEIVTRGKMGFGVPVGRWMRGPLRELVADVVLSRRSFERGYVDEDRARSLVAEHLNGDADHTPFLWALLMLELWFQECVEGGIEVSTKQWPTAISRR
jgi:asparagine synthase (glutamine-hydrolysing)